MLKINRGINMELLATRVLSVGLASALLVGCANTPDVQVRYFQPKAIAAISLVQTAGCQKYTENGADKYVPYMLAEATMTTTYLSDRTSSEYIDMSKLDGALSNTTTAVNLRPDGRLMGISTESVGQGQEIIEGVLTVVDAAVAGGDDPGVVKVCKTLLSFKDGVFQLTRRASVDFSDARYVVGKNIDLPLSPGSSSSDLLTDLTPILGEPQITINLTAVPPSTSSGSIKESVGGIIWKGSKEALRLRQPIPQVITLKINPEIGQGHTEKFTIMDPTKGADVFVPLPRPPVFGTNSMVLQLSESGSITQLQYGSQSGARASLNAANSIVDSLNGPSRTELLQELTTENNILAQQRRRMVCLTTDTCT